MGKFSTAFKINRITEWNGRYFDYQALSDFIKEQSSLIKNGPSPSDSQTQALNKTELIQVFTNEVDKELKKVYVFYLNRERELYKSINTRLHYQKNYYNIDSKQIENEFNQLLNVSNQALAITHFVSMNIQALERILHKFDKHFKTIGTTVYRDYVLSKFEVKDSDLLYLFKFKLIDEVCALLTELQKELLSSYNIEVNSNYQITENVVSPTGQAQDTPFVQNDNNPTNNTDSNAVVPISVIQNKYNLITLDVNDIERRYQKMQLIHRAWIRLLKLKEYSYGVKSDKTNSSIEIEDNLLMGENDLLSNANKWNVTLTILQKCYMTACASFIIPNIGNALYIDFKDLEGDQTILRFFSGIIIACTSIGGIISLILTRFIITKTYKVPMVTSCILSVIGNLLYSFSFGLNSDKITPTLRIVLFCLSRILIGIALNNRVHRKYILEFIPRRKISNYMMLFKLFSLIGNVIGPCITLLCSFYVYEKDDFFQFDSYDVPSWLFSIGAVVVFILMVMLYKEPVSSNFNAYSEGNAPIEHASRSSSFDLGESLSEKDNKEIQSIDDRLFKINEESQFSDTNLVQHSINNIITRERAPSNTIGKSLNLVLINIFISNFITSSLLVLSPLYINKHYIINEHPSEKKEEEVDRYVCYLIISALLLFVPIYFVNLFYISVKLDKRIYMLVLNVLMIICAVLLWFTIDNFVYYCCLFFGLIIFGYLFEDTSVYFFTKMVPNDFRLCYVTSASCVQFISYAGMCFGSAVSVIGYFNDVDPKMYGSCFRIVTAAYVVLLCGCGGMLALWMKRFKEGPIRRIIRDRNFRKVRRTEF